MSHKARIITRCPEGAIKCSRFSKSPAKFLPPCVGGNVLESKEKLANSAQGACSEKARWRFLIWKFSKKEAAHAASFLLIVFCLYDFYFLSKSKSRFANSNSITFSLPYAYGHKFACKRLNCAERASKSPERKQILCPKAILTNTGLSYMNDNTFL